MQHPIPMAKNVPTQPNSARHQATEISAVQLYRWIEEGENRRQDFKETITSSRKIARTLAAFANAEGGRLLVGVRDNRSLRNIRPADETEMLLGAARHFCQPEVSLKFETVKVGMKEILVVQILEAKDKPIRNLNEEGDWEVYLRSGDQCLLASPMSIKMLQNYDAQETEPLLEFGSREQAVLAYLRKHQRMSLHDCRKMFNLSTGRAHRMLLQLTRAGLITLHNHEKEEFFTLGKAHSGGSDSDRSAQWRP
jgi:predicted HTH transcriptional regulator